MRHSLTTLLAASGTDSPAHGRSLAQAAPGPDPRGSRGWGCVPSPKEMEEEAIASVPRNEMEDVDFLSGLELVDLLDPRQPDWPLEPGLSSPWGAARTAPSILPWVQKKRPLSYSSLTCEGGED
ncbi:PREDICTED: CREB/ATF bZIP transcription factor [Myotis davidii]|uniref:CREB/ATF bZIP transcription factor n=1 Tax=Myotis davidii TaxID=225400 RepID=UPI000767A944|nr:PREDICTED: CREB/ATF bZIP transcription factor [Myotis davidii]